MEYKSSVCYFEGEEFGKEVVKRKYVKYETKMKQFLATIGVRPVDEEMMELIEMSNKLNTESGILLEALINGSEDKKKKCVLFFTQGYIDGRLKENGKKQ